MWKRRYVIPMLLAAAILPHQAIRPVVHVSRIDLFYMLAIYVPFKYYNAIRL